MSYYSFRVGAFGEDSMNDVPINSILYLRIDLFFFIFGLEIVDGLGADKSKVFRNLLFRLVGM